nr:uncharacterized protein LOC109152184 [Ipomoea trifida]
MPAATSFLSSPAGASHLPFSLVLISSSSSSTLKPHVGFIFNSLPKCPPRLLFSSPQAATGGRSSLLLRPSALAVDDALGQSADTFSVQPKIDKSGRFCSPRAARELALMTLYASCLEGTDPVRLFEKRLSIRREPGYEFDKECLTKYNHMSFGGPPVTTETLEEADQLELSDEKESEVEAEVLSAPPKLVYSKLILRFTRKLLVAVAEKWDSHVLVIDKVVPHNWKSEPAGRILELSILHLAMSEIAVLGTRHQIVINEAVDLAKRFCDGAAPRIINGCLRTFVKDLGGTSADRITNSSVKQSVFT